MTNVSAQNGRRRVGFNPEVHHRRSIRLKGYDYSQPGVYFITICVQNKRLLLQPEPVREMIKRWWNELPNKFGRLELDAFEVMPNHLHGIIMVTDEFVGATLRGRPDYKGQPHRAAPTVGDVVDWLKTMTTNEYIREVRQHNWPPFEHRLWQRNYYERILRDEKELQRAREYIDNNPLLWTLDRENPERAEENPEDKWLYGKDSVKRLSLE